MNRLAESHQVDALNDRRHSIHSMNDCACVCTAIRVVKFPLVSTSFDVTNEHCAISLNY